MVRAWVSARAAIRTARRAANKPMSTKRRTLGVWSAAQPLGPGGEKLCYNCRGALPKGRRYNCSPVCSDNWRLRTSPSAVRRKVWERDHGICAHCARDMDALQRAFRAIRDIGESRAFLAIHGIPSGRASSDWWDADHIMPVIEGGGECGLDNYRTLCIRCHAVETKRLAGDRARRRRLARPLPLFDDVEEGLPV
ncbi:HNH endonuclease [bacterium]|nr:MAG: HNH endonuclease [bacterium]